MPQCEDGHPASSAFWLKPVNLFGLFELTVFIADLDTFTLPTV
jgi:hypothetical protein